MKNKLIVGIIVVVVVIGGVVLLRQPDTDNKKLGGKFFSHNPSLPTT